jgi:hypothetical protein
MYIKIKYEPLKGRDIGVDVQIILKLILEK